MSANGAGFREEQADPLRTPDKHRVVDLQHLAADWPAISRRLDEALALAPAERSTWLDALDEGDSIKAKLRQLLSEAGDVECFFF